MWEIFIVRLRVIDYDENPLRNAFSVFKKVFNTYLVGFSSLHKMNCSSLSTAASDWNQHMIVLQNETF